MATCVKCGRQNKDSAAFCAACGAPLPKNVAPPAPASAPPPTPRPASASALPQTASPGVTTLIQLGVVIAIGILIPLLLGNILGAPARWLKGVLPQWTCSGILEGTFPMYLCSLKVGLMTILPAILVIVVIFFLRKALAKLGASINSKLPPAAHFVVPVALATIIFTMSWAGYHEATWGTTGIVPNRIFPLFIALFTWVAIQFGPQIQKAMSGFFRSRDKVPTFLRYLLVIGIPMAIALLITKQAYVSREALKEQFVVLVGLILAFLLVSPSPKPLLAGVGNAPQRNRGPGRVASVLFFTVLGSFIAHILFDSLWPQAAFAGDCSSESDCQQTAGYNASTATGGGVIAGVTGAIGTQLGGTAAGGAAGGEAGTLLCATAAGDGTAAAGTAAAGGDAGAAAGTAAGTPENRIIDGRAATAWMVRNGYLNADGTVTPEFTRWWNSQGGDGSRLTGIAGDIHVEDGRIVGDPVIIVQDPTGPRHDRPAPVAGAGGQVVTENFSPGVDIRGTPDYIEDVRGYLNTIKGTKAGDDLLGQLMVDGMGGGHNVTITDWPPGNTGGNYNQYANPAAAHTQADGSNGAGSNSTVAFNPYAHSVPHARNMTDAAGNVILDAHGNPIPDPTDWRNRSPDVALLHELNHSLHATQGGVDGAQQPDPVSHANVTNEDLRTVGLDPFGRSSTSENTYRTERGYPIRTTYHSDAEP